MRLARLNTGRGDFGDFIEIAHHQAATRQFDQLVSFAIEATELLGREVGELSVAAFLGQVLPMVPTDTQGFQNLARREADALQNAGSISAAVDRASAMVNIALARVEADPTNGDAQTDLADAYFRHGDLMVLAGNRNETERLYRDGLAIIERLAEADPTNTSVQRDLG